MQDCESCQQALSGSVRVAPWEDGDNEYGYIRCRHCQHKNVIYDD